MNTLDIFQWLDGPAYMVTRIDGDWVLMMVEHGTHGVEMVWRKVHAVLCDERWQKVCDD